MTSTDYACEIMYLVRKVGGPHEYTRVTDYQIFNTEARAQLFSHAFGYKQKAFDFGTDFEVRPERDEEERKTGGEILVGEQPRGRDHD